MKLFIAGMGWITPLGGDVSGVWDRLLKGEEAKPEEISDVVGEGKYWVFRVPENALTNLPRHPRLRRASNISRFAAAAGLAALENARSTIGQIDLRRTALIFAISNGGVIYTRRFYHDIVATGAEAASPLLFPETVFNAPASHLAAIVGIEGASYTLVGDGAVGLLALKMAEDMLASDTLDCCLIVGAEEADWLLCDAYRKWRLLRSAPPIEPFAIPPRGMILSEGAGSLLVARSGAIEIDVTDAGSYYSSRKKAREVVNRVAASLATPNTRLVISSANGTFVDKLEADAIGNSFPRSLIYSVKPALGESVGAGSIWQIVVAAQALRTNQLPPLLHVKADCPERMPVTATTTETRDAVVLSCGLNQQIAGLRLSI